MDNILENTDFRSMPEISENELENQLYQVNLDTMPDVAMREILKNCDVRSILTLRKVCHPIRNFIDIEKTDFYLKNIRIRMDSSTISLKMDFEIWKRVSNIDINYSKNPGKLESEKIFGTDLKIILNHQKSILEGLYVHFMYDSKEEEKENSKQFGLKPLKSALESMENLSKVRKLTMTVVNQEDIMSVLPYLDSQFLEEISICYSQIFKLTSLEMDQIVQLDHWKKSKTLHLWGFLNSVPIQQFMHFSGVNIQIETLSAEDLLFLKETSLHSPTFKYFQIGVSHGDIDNLEMFESGNPCYIQIQDTDEAVRIAIEPWNARMIYFTRVQLTTIPRNALIQN